MSVPSLNDQSSFGGLEELLTNVPTQSPHYDRTHVLEEIEDNDELRDQHTVLLCPNCATIIEEYTEGLPVYISSFYDECDTCDVELYRWSVVAIPVDIASIISTVTLQRLVTEYWDRHLWDGIKTAEQCPRTREYLRLYDDQAETFGWDWRPSCPLCRRSIDDIDYNGLDYHHWSRSPDIGVCLCRECHDVINGGDRDADVDWQARRLGLQNKHDLQILRLAIREQSVAPVSTLESLANRLVTRYNLVQDPQIVECILDQAQSNDGLRSALNVDSLVVSN